MTTQLIRGLYNIKPIQKGAVVTIGNFDGIHQGHKALIDKVKTRAKSLHVPAIVITFEPQPKEFFAKKENANPVARLTRWREKFSALAATHIDGVLVLRFNQAFSELSADDFIKRILVDGLAVEHVIVGDDFRFGHRRVGDFLFLQQAGQRYGFTVEAMPSLLLDDKRVSSTLVRQALQDDDLDLAKRLLGHAYQMQGRIVHGDKLGRQLGFPTANIHLHRAATPLHGIYTVLVHGIKDRPLPGVANVGTRPAVSGTRTLLEVYLFDFDEDLYGRHVNVEFCKKLREEEHYVNLELLKAAIANDVVIAQQYFEERGKI